MFDWFAPRSVVTPGFEEWCDQMSAWLVERDGRASTAASPLFRPTVEDFPAAGLQGHDLAEHWFTLVQARSGMADRPCRLVPQGQACGGGPCVLPYGQEGHGVAGVFTWAPAETVITYDPALLSRSVELIASFAHELGRGLLGRDAEGIPGGAVHQEEAADVAAIHLGWGLFQLRASRRLAQTCCGFGVVGSGHLTRAQSSHALALFCRRRSVSLQDCADHLDGDAWHLLKRAGRWLERRERMRPPCRLPPPA